jgi:ribosomal protein L39E
MRGVKKIGRLPCWVVLRGEEVCKYHKRANEIV